jgi:hypothetical protein
LSFLTRVELAKYSGVSKRLNSIITVDDNSWFPLDYKGYGAFQAGSENLKTVTAGTRLYSLLTSSNQAVYQLNGEVKFVLNEWRADSAIAKLPEGLFALSRFFRLKFFEDAYPYRAFKCRLLDTNYLAFWKGNNYGVASLGSLAGSDSLFLSNYHNSDISTITKVNESLVVALVNGSTQKISMQGGAYQELNVVSDTYGLNVDSHFLTVGDYLIKYRTQKSDASIWVSDINNNTKVYRIEHPKNIKLILPLCNSAMMIACLGNESGFKLLKFDLGTQVLSEAIVVQNKVLVDIALLNSSTLLIATTDGFVMGFDLQANKLTFASRLFKNMGRGARFFSLGSNKFAVVETFSGHVFIFEPCRTQKIVIPVNDGPLPVNMMCYWDEGGVKFFDQIRVNGSVPVLIENSDFKITMFGKSFGLRFKDSKMQQKIQITEVSNQKGVLLQPDCVFSGSDDFVRSNDDNVILIYKNLVVFFMNNLPRILQKKDISDDIKQAQVDLLCRYYAVMSQIDSKEIVDIIVKSLSFVDSEILTKIPNHLKAKILVGLSKNKSQALTLRRIFTISTLLNSYSPHRVTKEALKEIKEFLSLEIINKLLLQSDSELNESDKHFQVKSKEHLRLFFANSQSI